MYIQYNISIHIPPCVAMPHVTFANWHTQAGVEIGWAEGLRPCAGYSSFGCVSPTGLPVHLEVSPWFWKKWGPLSGFISQIAMVVAYWIVCWFKWYFVWFPSGFPCLEHGQIRSKCRTATRQRGFEKTSWLCQCWTVLGMSLFILGLQNMVPLDP